MRIHVPRQGRGEGGETCFDWDGIGLVGLDWIGLGQVGSGRVRLTSGRGSTGGRAGGWVDGWVGGWVGGWVDWARRTAAVHSCRAVIHPEI